MNVLITGGDGFLGRALAARLRDGRRFGSLRRLTLLGLEFDTPSEDVRARQITGSITDSAVIADALSPPPDLVFHLAAVTSGEAEARFDAGLRVNVNGTISLLEALREQRQNAVVLFPSTIAVFGPPYPARVDDDTWPVPALSYGAEKLACEVLVAEYTRRGWLQGRSVRLPSIVARPAMRTGAASAFTSELIRELASGRSFVSPVSPHATHWLMSMPRGIENLLHAATLPPEAFGPRRVLTLPAVHVSTTNLVAAIARRCGSDVLSRISYVPQAALDRTFGSFPPLVTAAAESAGFTGDGDADTLVDNALSGLETWRIRA